MPVFVGGDAADALGQFNELATRQRCDGGTFEQSFARVYSDPANTELAKRERGQNRPLQRVL